MRGKTKENVISPNYVHGVPCLDACMAYVPEGPDHLMALRRYTGCLIDPKAIATVLW